ncbi:MAG: DNA repair protein RecN, partial [Coriobacteriia bacterium]|nr:DNA repair protein RecN [Coriobacteriia bacterium]
DPALDVLAERLADTSAIVDDIGLELREYGEAIEHDPAALDRAEARLATLAGLKKKYGPELADVLRAKQEAEEALASLDDGGRSLEEARVNVDAAKRALEDAADVLRRVRLEAVDSFVADLQSAASDLAMAEARFSIAVTELDFESWTADGPDRVEFLYAPAGDQPFHPLSKIASGGEVSRVMLAMKGVLGAADKVPVLVFDEVDSGVGGAAAVNVGRRLAELGESHQVLVVTHLAQVAAFAERHLVVEKHVENGSVTTSVRSVEGDERVVEIARMLSGGDTETGRAHAEELLAAAGSRTS